MQKHSVLVFLSSVIYKQEVYSVWKYTVHSS